MILRCYHVMYQWKYCHNFFLFSYLLEYGNYLADLLACSNLSCNSTLLIYKIMPKKNSNKNHAEFVVLKFYITFYNGCIIWIFFSKFGFAENNWRVFSFKISRAWDACAWTTWSASVESIRFKVRYKSIKCDSRTCEKMRRNFETRIRGIDNIFFFFFFKKNLTVKIEVFSPRNNPETNKMAARLGSTSLSNCAILRAHERTCVK